MWFWFKRPFSYTRQNGWNNFENGDDPDASFLTFLLSFPHFHFLTFTFCKNPKFLFLLSSSAANAQQILFSPCANHFQTIFQPFANLTMRDQQTHQTTSLPSPLITLPKPSFALPDRYCPSLIMQSFSLPNFITLTPLPRLKAILSHHHHGHHHHPHDYISSALT